MEEGDRLRGGGGINCGSRLFIMFGYLCMSSKPLGGDLIGLRFWTWRLYRAYRFCFGRFGFCGFWVASLVYFASVPGMVCLWRFV